MDEAAIASLGNVLGKRLAWGELFEKDTYNYASYINDPYLENGSSKLPADIAETVYDPARQYWGGHWTLPSSADIQEFIDNTEIVSTENVASSELGKDICKITFRSKRNGKEITMLTNGYATNATVSQNLNLYYMSSSRAGYAYCGIFNNNPAPKVTTTYRYVGLSVRPVLKERYVYTNADKKDIVVRHIDDLAVDLGITKTVTENGEKVTYKLLWSPFNYGVESKVDLETYNDAPIDNRIFIANCTNQPGMRLAWGDTEEREYFNTPEYKNSEIAKRYAWYRNYTDLDIRDLQLADDIVQINWPDGWYIPTAQDYQLLAENTTVTTETKNGKTWFKLTSKKDEKKSIMIPATYYIDDAKNEEKWSSEAYLQSSTIGYSTSTPSKPICYALKLSGTTASLANNAGRPTGLMVRPVRYVRVN